MTVAVTSFVAFDSFAVRAGPIPICGIHDTIRSSESNELM